MTEFCLRISFIVTSYQGDERGASNRWNLLLSTKTNLRAVHFQNGLSQLAIDKQLSLTGTAAFKFAFQVLESSARERVPAASGHSSLDTDNSSCGLWHLSLLWRWPNPSDYWNRLPHVTLASWFPAMNAALSTSRFAVIFYTTRLMCPMSLSISPSLSLYIYIYMPRILMWKINIMRKISVYFRQNVFY